MSSGFHVDTASMAQTSLKAGNSADQIITYFRTLDSETGQVLPLCKGPMFSELGNALVELQTRRDQLIPQLQAISEQLKQGGQGMTNQSDTGASSVRSVVGSALNTPLNHS